MRESACITTSWDDGHPLDLRVAELLAKYGVQGTFYIPRTTQRETLTAGQIRQISRCFEVGSHTLHHVDLTKSDEAVAKAEIGQSKAWIEDITGGPCVMFCPPMGRYQRRDLSLAKEAGYAGVRTVELLSLAWPRLVDGLHLMPTTVQAYPHATLAYAKNALRRGAIRNGWLYMVHGKSGGWEEMVERIVTRRLTKGGVFHLWGHSWEIEEMGQWEQVETALKLLGQLGRAVPTLTNGRACSACDQQATACVAGADRD